MKNAKTDYQANKQFFTNEEIETIEDALEEAIHSLMEVASWQIEKRAKECIKEIEKYRSILEKIRNKGEVGGIKNV